MESVLPSTILPDDRIASTVLQQEDTFLLWALIDH
jgi:hypothetical protein